MTFLQISLPKPAGAVAVVVVLRAKIAPKALFFGEDLHQHDGDKCAEHQQRLPRAQPAADAQVIDETAREHGVTAEAVRPVGHQMAGALADFVPEGIERVAVALALHVHNRPNAQAKAKHTQDSRQSELPLADRPQRRPTRSQPHRSGNQHNKHQAAQQIAGRIADNRNWGFHRRYKLFFSIIP